eukprot:CAMPEP_0168535288 /NCGR_PEP_ID=MMETSP0405-20121227/18558_1 /TAXON_ID=498012 /ORGANISM="Trichosphaerium sp, Strain Am-I-7 wt" /LENGTH=285 /DNA_ID=CAMNT_0008562461 /DNA_START=60 /DNA_END=918 /DNA_ORIENTATION=+
MKRRRANDGSRKQATGNAAGSVSHELLESVKVARNKEVVQRVIREVFNKKQYDLIEQYYDRRCTFPAVVRTFKGIPKAMREAGIRNPKECLDDNKDGQALQIVKTACKFYSTAFPDLHYTITSLIGEGDTVAVHWEVTGHHLGPLTLTPDCVIQPTGNEVNVSATAILKLKNDKIIEVRQNVDQLALFQQLNVLDQLYLLQPNATQPQAQPQRTTTPTTTPPTQPVENMRTTPPMAHRPTAVPSFPELFNRLHNFRQSPLFALLLVVTQQMAMTLGHNRRLIQCV